MSGKQKFTLLRIIVTAVMLAVFHFLPLTGVMRFAAYFTAYLIIGGDILVKAGKGIKNGRVFDENFLMAAATAGAIALAVYQTGDYTEAVAVMLFFQTGELFESRAVGKSRKNIRALTDIRPDYANIDCGGTLKRVNPENVETGSIIIVQSGEKIPLDGVVVKGEAELNTAALTGESLPRFVTAGDEVIGGSINTSGVLHIRTTKQFGESAVSKILDLIENAGSRKSKPERFISGFARVYTPAVCFCALVLAVLPPLVRSCLSDLPADWEIWIYRALTFLVVSCPCALVVSIPLTFFAGIGGAAKAGILIKGSDYLEALSKTKIVVFDKTGTLTQGVFEVRAVHHNEINEAELIELAALAESGSSHPIGKSLQRAYGKEIDRSRVSDFREISGKGVVASVDGLQIAAGNDKLMKQLGIKPAPCRQAGTIIHTAVNGKYAGHIVIADVVKPKAKEAVAALKAAGVEKTVLLTGDTDAAGKQTAAFLGIDEAYGGLLPAGKVEKVEELLKNKPEKAKLAFAGDGLNDAPVLSRADIGIAMGAIGSDAAIEAADVVLTDDDLTKIATAVRSARKCTRIVYENIWFALSVKSACLLSGAFGIADMGAAVFADVGVMVIAVLNALRALRVEKQKL